MQPIYLDHNATTPLAPAALSVLNEWSPDELAHPNAPYRSGRRAHKALNTSRERLAACFQSHPSEWVFTSGATESNITVLHHHIMATPNPRLLIGATEHPSVIRTAEQYAQIGRCQLKWVPTDTQGQVDVDWLNDHIAGATALFLMSVNNETGTCLNHQEVATIVREHDVWWHCDMVAEAGKRPINLSQDSYTAITTAAISAHKCNGPKGLGLLYLRRGHTLIPMMPAMSQEGGLRAGTPDARRALAFAAAMEVPHDDRLQALAPHMWQAIKTRFPESVRNGHPTAHDGRTLNVSLRSHGRWADAESLVVELALKEIAVATGAACTTGSQSPSHVLLAMDRTAEQAQAAIRFSFGQGNSTQDVERVIDALATLIG